MIAGLFTSVKALSDHQQAHIFMCMTEFGPKYLTWVLFAALAVLLSLS